MARRAKYTAARYYYQGAYRERIKAIRTEWSAAQITSTVAWMWTHVATQAERTECKRLHEQRSPDNTFAADDERIPAEVKRASDPAPAPAPSVPNPDINDAGSAGGAGAPERAAGVDAGTDARPDAGIKNAPTTERGTQTPANSEMQVRVGATGSLVGPTQADTRVNTTRFFYMPLSIKETHSLLPPLDGELDTAKKRTLTEAELGDPHSAQEGKRWRGAHFLGAGATGNCTLWVRTDEMDNIEERLAVRDIASLHQRNWVDPTSWRDRLPREIAIMKRLEDQGGAANNIHRYFGHRIDMYQRRYRIYTEVCDLDNIESALEHYSRPWRRRRNLYKWLLYANAQPNVIEARLNSNWFPLTTAETMLRDEKNETWRNYKDAKIEDPEIHPGKDFEDMSDIEDWHMDELEDDLPPVIPEAFLWHVFDQLVDAALIMHRGADPLVGKEQWKEIVHKDMHTGNIFVKPKVEGFFGSDSTKDPKRPNDRSFTTFKRPEYPDIVLADFDTAIFDLQDGDDEYQDNPLHYVMDRKQSGDAQGGRYPPEAFWEYQYRPGSRNLTKFTSATDVWGIGQIMWNLAMNLPHSPEYVAPFYDDTDSHRGVSAFQRVNNGREYKATTLNECLMTGHRPFEASHRYSEELRTGIRKCLNYHPQHRIKLDRLKALTARNLRLHMNRQGPADDLVVRVDGKMQGFKVGDTFVYVPPADDSDEVVYSV